MPRTCKLNRDVLDAILTYKENGLTDKDICDIVGIDQSTFYAWLQDAERIKSGEIKPSETACGALKVELSDGLKRARVSFKAYHIQNITKASRKEWTASAWLLERFYPKEFGRIDRQVALMGEANKENGMLDEILDYMRLRGDGEKA